jgi:hypothetical protein
MESQTKLLDKKYTLMDKNEALVFIDNFLHPKGPGFDKGTKVINRQGTETGASTGGFRGCACGSGRRIAVKWPDGKLTYPCTAGMTFDADTNTWRID